MSNAATDYATQRERDHRATVADTLLQLLMQGVVTRGDCPKALAALGLVWPDLDAAMTRRRRVGWTGPTPGPVPVAAPIALAYETPAERVVHTTHASHAQVKYRDANPAPGVKRCARCRESFPIESFRLKSASSGSTIRWSYCEPCRHEKQRERYLSVKKARMLNEVGLSFIVSESDDVEGLVCLECLRPIVAGEAVHGRACLVHEECRT